MTANNQQNIDSIFSIGSELMEWGDYLEALDRFIQVYQANPTHEQNLENLTYCYYCTSNEKQLVKFANLLTELNTGNSHGEYYIGRHYHRVGRNKDALPHILNAIEMAPDDSEALTLAGRCYMYLGEFKTSLEYHNRALEKDSKNAWAYYNRAKLQYAQGEYEEVLRDLDLAIQYGKDKSQPRRFLVHAYFKVGDINNSISLATSLLKDDSHDLAVLANRAVAYAKTNEHEAAEADNQRCIQVATQNIKNRKNLTRSFFWRAFAYANLNKIEEAKHDIDQLRQLNSVQADSMIERIKELLGTDLLAA